MSTSPPPQQSQPSQLPGVRLVEVRTHEERERWRAGFVAAYQQVFSGAPYFERYAPTEIRDIWHRLTGRSDSITMIAATDAGKVVGFGIGIGLNGQRDVARRLDGLVSVPHTYYLAELGVLPAYRGQGIAHQLVRARLSRIDHERFRAVVLRASATRSGSYRLYTSLGFEETGEDMHVSHLRVDGQTTLDRRVFLHCVLSQIRVDGRPPTP